MREVGFITNAAYREAFAVTRRQAKTALAAWVDEGTLKVEGRDRRARYLPGPKWPPAAQQIGMAGNGPENGPNGPENGPNGQRERKFP